MVDSRYDVIIVGSGPGGGTLALELARTGKRILILERGDYLKREPDNWSPKAVFVDGKYQAKETWRDRSGHTFHPGLHYVVGGNSKVYGGALYRLREEDFGDLQHKEGVSPAWPLPYDVFEPYYTRAERLFHVHGERGADPTEPWASAPYPHPPVRHEPPHPGAARQPDKDRPPPLSAAPGDPPRRGAHRPGEPLQPLRAVRRL